ncbi:hypothetical protein [Dysosmobacter sp.]|uniref:hypothetical protein n=1 Tax=Dysosmobacter sp. TaxID=2591382 RepID=UPI00267276BA|nr:hypothetical protein [Dysosmobacter sp.]MCI7282495.1 hypothetical protein [Dysosmobacter sp.]
MGKLTKQNSNLPTLPTKNPDKTETWAGKHTARVTKIFNQPDDPLSRPREELIKMEV